MNTVNMDNQLLAEYANNGSEGAFRELVQRHINMVHSAALREAGGNATGAEDITQEVFTHLAQRAGKLSSHPSLAGWLYTCVRQMAANNRRAEHRRQRREQETFLMNELLGPNSDDQLWKQVRPVLDDVMHELEDEDRTAVVLRFFEGLSLKEVGVALGLTENAARMRVERSLEKLHTRLSRRGIHSTASTLAAVLVAGTVLSTSSTFASTVATSAMASAAASHASAFSLGKVLSLTRSKAVVLGSAAILASGLLLWKHFDATSNSAAPTRTAESVIAATIAATPDNSTAPQASAVANASTTNSAAQGMALQLLDSESGEPLAGAKLYLFYMYNDGRGKVFHDVTDAHGRFAVNALQDPYHGLNLFVTADGHVPMVTSFGFRRDMPSAYTMKLERGVSIGGTVVDENQRPVANAKIQFSGHGNDPSLADNIQFGPDTTVVTDANGQWSCDMIPKDYADVRLRASASDHAETNLTVHPTAADANKLVVTLPPGFSVKGSVVDASGNPIAGAKVRQVRLNNENEQKETTDDSGAFEFKAMAAGELMLSVQADGFAPAVQTLQLSGNVEALKFQLGPGQTLRGRIVDEQGNVIPFAFVETTRSGIDKVRWSTKTDANGRFEWDSAPTEPLAYSVLAQGFNRAYAQTLQADGTEHVIKLTRENAANDDIQITGSVVDAETGGPMSAFKVSLGELDPQWAFPLRFYTTGTNGQFTMSLPKDSSHPGYVVVIEQNGYLPSTSPNLLITNGNQKLQFKMQKGSGPNGVVLLPNGQPAANANVLLCTTRAGVILDGPAHVEKQINTTTYQTSTDITGKFALAEAIDPEGLIIIHDQGFAMLSKAELPTGGNITLQPWGSVKGKLMNGSQPAANDHVVALNEIIHYLNDGRDFGFFRFRFEATTDANGNFLFDKVPPGKTIVAHGETLQHWSLLSDTTSITVAAGATSEVTLGGSGTTVIGKATLATTGSPIDWQNAMVRLQTKLTDVPTSRPKREDFPTLEAFAAASDAFFLSFEKQNSFGTLCGSDGSFQISNVPAGTYQLTIEIRDTKQNSPVPHNAPEPDPVLDSVTREIVVPDGTSTEPMDLGAIQLLPKAVNVTTK